jgi:hypothetical protein
MLPNAYQWLETWETLVISVWEAGVLNKAKMDGLSASKGES